MFIAQMKETNMNLRHKDGTEILVRNNVLMCDDKLSKWVKDNYSESIISSETISDNIKEDISVQETPIVEDN